MLALIIDDKKVREEIECEREIQQKVLLDRARAKNQVGRAAHGIPRQIGGDVERVDLVAIVRHAAAHWQPVTQNGQRVAVVTIQETVDIGYL